MQEEVSRQTIAYSVKVTKMTGKVFLEVIKAASKKIQSHKAKSSQQPIGQVKIKELAKGGGLSNIELPSNKVQNFDRIARKYGIQYTIKKDKTTNPPRFLVFFNGKNTDALQQAFREFTHKEMKRSNQKKPSLHQKLSSIKKTLDKQPKEVQKKREISL